MDLELSGRRVTPTWMRSRTREVIRSGVVAETARLFDDPNNRTTTTDYRKSEGRYSSALVAAVRCDDVFVGVHPGVSHSDHCGAAVDNQLHAIDIARVVGGEEQRGRRDLLRAAHLSPRDHGLELRLRRLVHHLR